MMPGPTVMARLLLLPRLSLTLTVSTWLPTDPALYRPLASMVPPDGLGCTVQLYGDWPPMALSWMVPSGGVVVVGATMLTPSPTMACAVALLPYWSVALTTSVTLAAPP